MQNVKRTSIPMQISLFFPNSWNNCFSLQAVLDEAEFQEKTGIVQSLQRRLSTLTAGGVLCTTQLSDEVASKQKIHDELKLQLQEKRANDRQDKLALS